MSWVDRIRIDCLAAGNRVSDMRAADVYGWLCQHAPWALEPGQPVAERWVLLGLIATAGWSAA